MSVSYTHLDVYKRQVINRSNVSLRIMVFRPTFSTGSLPQSTSFRMVFLPIPVHSAASSMVSPILTALILSTSFLKYSFCNYCFIIILILPSLANPFCNHTQSVSYTHLDVYKRQILTAVMRLHMLMVKLTAHSAA